MDQDTTLEKITRLVQPLLDEMGLELADLEFKREGRDWFLRFFLDKPGGITLDDCAEVSREISALLEVEDPIECAYRLEVSSPGLDRPLKRAADYQRFIGEMVKIKTYEKLDPDGRGHERKTFAGRLEGFDGEIVRVLQLDKKGGEVSLSLAAIAKAQLDPQF